MGVISDTIQIAKIVAVVATLFNMNSFQENQLKNYVKMEQYSWIQQRRSEQEVEEMIKNEARYITKD